jgi:arylsulfatase A-like enzyme
MKQRRRHLLLWRTVVAAIVLLGMCVLWLRRSDENGSSPSTRSGGQPNVIIILVDTLRPDYLGTYGFQADVSPNMDAFASESVKFTNAFAHSPWTRPSVATLFTSLYPQTHGQISSRYEVHTRLPAEATTLAELLKNAGYETAAFNSQSWIDEKLGMAQGFDHFEQHVGYYRGRAFSGIPLVLGMENWVRGLRGESAPSEELHPTIVEIIRRFRNCRLLVWGIPDDAQALCEANEAGTTVFIEDRGRGRGDHLRRSGCRVVPVDYDVAQKDAFSILDEPSSLGLDLGPEILDTKFDVVVVAGPRQGGNWPGRMKPIFMSARLSHIDSHVFVVDYDQTVEAAFSERYLFPKFGMPELIGKRPLVAHFSTTQRTEAGATRSRQVGPIFVYMHFIDVHGAYRCNRSDFQAVAGSPTLGANRRLTRLEESTRPFYLGAAIDWWDDGMRLDLRNWKTCYAAATRRFDRLFGRLEGRLKELDLFENSVIILIADHGEEFLERGHWHHGSDLNSPQLRIPLLIRLPGGEHAGMEHDGLVGLVDIMPTVLSLAGVDAKTTEQMEGRDLSALWSGRSLPGGEGVFTTGIDGERASSVVGLFEKDYAAVWDYPDGPIELFELEDGGRRQRAFSDADMLEAFKVKLTDRMRDLARREALGAEEVILDEKTVDELKSLGYLQ